ncbi:thioredoxin domain-containing protein [Nonlabens xiamenensis]|uniref:hypothetical protein n=1 Tax=Nonlabens xiamenensis TaxID=2341043 RepID=UPI0013DD9A19|nr:hypothetical protein [Nonlabens xiamenensis]
MDLVDRQKSLKLRRSILLLLFLVTIALIGCKQDSKEKFKDPVEVESEKAVADYTFLKSVIPAKTYAGLNLTLPYQGDMYFSFSNPSSSDSTIIYKFENHFRPHVAAQFDGSDFRLDFVYLTNESDTINLDLMENGNLGIKDDSLQLQINNLINRYMSVFWASKKSEYDKATIKAEITAVREKNKNERLSYHNDLLFYTYLEKVDPRNTESDFFFKQLKPNSLIINTLFGSLPENHLNSRIRSYNFNDYQSIENDYCLKLYKESMFRILSFEDNIGDHELDEAIAWFKSTKEFQRDSVALKSKIEPLDAITFKEKIQRLKFNGEQTFENIMKANPNEFYLIDFWATWCAPCIEGVKLIKGMKLPYNIEVISVSLDKDKDFKKWQDLT